MNSRARAFVFALLLAAGLSAGCVGTTDLVNLNKLWDKMDREAGP
jgi:hypothetical protein